MTVQHYPVLELPDPRQTTLRDRFGNVREAIAAGWESLLRTIAGFPADSLSLRLCHLYMPDLDRGTQGRLRLWIRASADERVPPATLRSLIEHGPIADFYLAASSLPDGSAAPAGPAPWEHLHDLASRPPGSGFVAVGEVVRRLDLLAPYIDRRDNNRVPSDSYQTVTAFVAAEGNDYLAVDRLLASLAGPAYLEIAVSPADAAAESKHVYGHHMYRTSLVNEASYRETTDRLENHRRQYGFMRDHLADRVLRSHEQLVESLRQPQLTFHCRVLASTTEDAHLLTATVAECAFQDGAYRLLLRDLGEAGNGAAPAADAATSHEWQHDDRVDPLLRRLARMAPVDELTGLFRLPVASTTSPRTIRKATDPPLPAPGRAGGRRSLLIGEDTASGSALHREKSASLDDLFDRGSSATLEHRLDLELLKKHMFVTGVPGSGKTTAIFNLLVQLHRNGIPFLVIESAKTEYRALKLLERHPDRTLADLGASLRVFTPGKENVAPFRLNPLAYPAGVSVDEHIGNLMTCFQAAMPMPPDTPLPAVLAEAVERVFDEHAAAASQDFPYLEDVVQKVIDYLSSPDLKYSSEIRDIFETAIRVRLAPLIRRSMGRVFGRDDASASDVDAIAELLRHPTVIELDALNQEQANLLTLFLLTSVREYLKTTRRSGEALRHVIVVEEAHNVVGRYSVESDGANPRAVAAEYVTRMLAEVRALGEGIVVVDQLPSTVADTVIKNTGIKLAHRLTSSDDREGLGSTMLLDDVDTEELARLRVGEAFYYHEGLYAPRRVRCIDANQYLAHSYHFAEAGLRPPSNDELLAIVRDEAWHPAADLEAFLASLTHEYGLFAAELGSLETNVERALAIADGQPIPGPESTVLLEGVADAEAVAEALSAQLRAAQADCERWAMEDQPSVLALEAAQIDLASRVAAISVRARDACSMLHPDDEEVEHGTR